MTIRSFVHSWVAAVARRRLARVLMVVVVAAAGVLTVSGAANASSSNFKPIKSSNGACLDVTAEDGYYNVGARVQQYHCTGAQEQQWKPFQIPSPIGGASNTWEIVSQRSGLCLGRSQARGNGEQAIQMECDGSAQVAWVAGNAGNGAYYLNNLYDFRVLDLSGNSSADHAKIQLWEYNQSNAQKWRSDSFPPWFVG